MKEKKVSDNVGKFHKYHIVASFNMGYKFKNKVFATRSQYISINNPLHRQSEKACMCFKMRCVRTNDFKCLSCRIWTKFLYWRTQKEPKVAQFPKNVPNAGYFWCPFMKLIFVDEFIFYTSSMYEIRLHCHWLDFSSFILNFGQCVQGKIGSWYWVWFWFFD